MLFSFAEYPVLAAGSFIRSAGGGQIIPMFSPVEPMQIALTGDVMLGRLVDQYVIRNRAFLPATMWGDVLPVMLSADQRLVNIECVISRRGTPWQPATKSSHFRAHPRAIQVLQAAEIGFVSLANNHILDYGPEAMKE